MKSLFNQYEAFNEDAKTLADAVDVQAKIWIDEYVAKGYRRRDIEYVIQSSIAVTSSEHLLRAALAKYKKKTKP